MLRLKNNNEHNKELTVIAFMYACKTCLEIKKE